MAKYVLQRIIIQAQLIPSAITLSMDPDDSNNYSVKVVPTY